MLKIDCKNKTIVELIQQKKDFVEKCKAKSGTWNEVRSTDNFVEKTLSFPWGERKVLYPKMPENNYMLQASRSITINKNDTEQEIKEYLEQNVFMLLEADHVRINELENLFGKDYYSKVGTVCEFGFRSPKLLNFYKQKNVKHQIGFEINDFNVSLGKHLGFKCTRFDLSLDNEENLLLNDVDLLLCYHVLEHLPNPFEGLRKIAAKIKQGAIMHLEIPVEPDGPRIKYGHLYPFHPLDLHHMCKELNLKIIFATNETHKNPPGPWIERYVVTK